MTQLQNFVSACLRSSLVRQFAWGLLCGLVLVCAVTPVRLLLGTSQEVDAAMALTGALCFWAGGILVRQRRAFISHWGWFLPAAGLWTLCLPTMLNVMLRGLSGISINSMELPVVNYVLMAVLTLAALAPAFLVLRIVQHQVFELTGSPLSWISGLVCACLILPAAILPYLGTLVIGVIGVVLCAGLIAWMKLIPAVAAGESTVSQADEQEPAQLGTRRSALVDLTAATTGAGLALTAFIAGQIIPRNLISDMALLVGLLLGACCTFKLLPQGKYRLPSSMVCLLLAAWVGVMSAGYPVWTLLCLRFNSWIENVNLLFTMRILLLASFSLPAGMIIGRLLRQTSVSGAHLSVPLCVTAGLVAARCLPGTPRVIALGLGLTALSLGLFWWSRENFKLPETRFRKFAAGTLSLLAVCGLTLSGNLDPRVSERVLFSGMAMQSFRQGIGLRQLPWIDESRQVAAFTSLNDHQSLWKQRGSQILLRHNGMVMGLHSTQESVCPHHPGDLLPVLLPLVLHPDPEQVLVVGAHPATLMTCHRWPLRQVETIDGSVQAHQMLTWLRSDPANGLQLQNGPTFQFHTVDPLLALRGRHEQQYDLITCPITHPSSVAAASHLTKEFYEQVCRHLTEDGIFSQRLPYFDLGPNVVQEVTTTLLNVFEDVLVIESVPGELIFVCSPGKLPQVDEALADRLKAPQCRALLGEAGWDWTLILGRGALTHDKLVEMTKDHKRFNSSSNSLLTFALPIEVSRWGHKADATRGWLAQYGSTLRESLGDSTIGKEVTERLEDLNLAHQIQRDHPNDPWAYRSALKSRLQDRPRTAIMQVNHQLKRVMDPEDQRRKEYLLALGPAAKNPQPELSAIEELQQYEAPFDPLVSTFLYFETANILSRCQPAVPAVQLQHLLHTVYYTSGYDQSVRNVGDALRILCEHKDVVESDAERWDQMNSLVQTLAQRWQLRLGTGRRSKYESADTEHSLEALKLAMSELERTYTAAGLSQKEWELRAQSLEQAVIRPLRQHRNQLARSASQVSRVQRN